MKSIRKFWYFGKNHRNSLSIEFSKMRWFGFDFSVAGGDGDEVQLAIYLWWSLWITLSVQKWFKVFNDWGWAESSSWAGHGHHIGIHYSSDHYLSAALWAWGMNADKRHWFWDIKNILFGVSKYSEVVRLEGDCKVIMPEGAYKATYKFFDSHWKRPRSPFTPKIERITIEIDGGIPIPGKGENSYDLDDDAVFSTTFPTDGKELWELCQRVAMDALKTRAKYETLAWKPDAGWKL